MKIKIATWNMDHWRRTHGQREAAWKYLFEDVAADIMLLQECNPPDITESQYNIIHRDIGGKRMWGSAVVSRGLPVQEVEFKNSYPGAVTAADVTLPDGRIVTAISLYGMFDEEGYVTAALHRVLSDLTPLLHKGKSKRIFVIGGDYNVSTQWDERYKNQDPAHRIVFSRLEDFGLVNCTFQHFNGHVRTNRHSKSDFPWQNDYIHVSAQLAGRLTHCQVIENSIVADLSDHNPVIVTFEI